jgi:predicted Rossmann fold nucleotide-binding protein DprA/Smf involved in DNA uptake
MARAEQADAAVIALIKDKPLSQADIVKATGAAARTCQQRLLRLQRAGVVQRNEDGMWSSP